MKNVVFTCLFSILFLSCGYAKSGKPVGIRVSDAPMHEVSIYGNSYVTSGSKTTIRIKNDGISGWTKRKDVISVYFSVSGRGGLDISLVGKNDGKSAGKLKITACSRKFKVRIPNTEMDTIYIGRVNVDEPGYVRVDMKGVSCIDNFGRFTTLVLGGEAVREGITSVPGVDDGNNWPYWGRRGPSVHMTYTHPEETEIRWFYNEVTVPENNDVLHSYFMSNGFGGGYMGMQVNGEKPENRRILFSVWSAYTTDNPKDIPEEYRIKMLRCGQGVHIGEFGNEGSGGQSYMYYPWEAGKTYRFLTEVVPDGSERTVYTGYFCGHDGIWKLVASFMRPEPGKQQETNYTHMHSFLENFDPEMGYKQRSVRFGNQWAVTTGGEWIELTEGTFTIDNTGRSGIRLDYDGGVDKGGFFLKNCGYFNGTVSYGTKFSRPTTGKKPDVDLGLMSEIPSVR